MSYCLYSYYSFAVINVSRWSYCFVTCNVLLFCSDRCRSPYRDVPFRSRRSTYAVRSCFSWSPYRDVQFRSRRSSYAVVRLPVLLLVWWPYADDRLLYLLLVSYAVVWWSFAVETCLSCRMPSIDFRCLIVVRRTVSLSRRAPSIDCRSNVLYAVVRLVSAEPFCFPMCCMQAFDGRCWYCLTSVKNAVVQLPFGCWYSLIPTINCLIAWFDEVVWLLDFACWNGWFVAVFLDCSNLLQKYGNQR